MEKRRKLQCLGGSIDFMGVKNGSISQGAELQYLCDFHIFDQGRRLYLLQVGGRDNCPLLSFISFFMNTVVPKKDR